ncbi:MAG: protease [Bacteroidia bacterium]|nr:MAG: protease [Bacteroidia bacterium]PIE85879.1 MAG: protease [Bacteroidia bacterium]
MKQVILLPAILLLLSLYVFGQEEAGLLRFPSINAEQIVFSKSGDLYTVNKKGGLARKLTNHEGYETFPKISPDGKWIAFTGQYDGNTEVFLMPSQGGAPKRLTYTATLHRDDVGDRMGPNNIVMAWTPDSKYIVYRSRKQTFNSFRGQLFKVSIDGGLSEEIPLANGGFCSYSPDGKKLAFNSIFREFRTWKYYKGGMADDIRIFDFETKKVVRICKNPNQDIMPMWYKDQIYYLSDRDRTMNLFCYDTKTKKTKKVSNYTEYDIKFPSIGKDAIVYENGGYIYVFDLKTQKAEKVKITIADDFLSSRPTIKDASKNINSLDISPDGKRVVLNARGDIFTVPAKSGITYNLTQTPGVHEKSVEWSPDGKYIAYISDKTGEFEIYIQKADGSEAAKQLTNNADTYKFYLTWSPDSKKILWNDRKMRLRYIDIQTKEVKTAAQDDNHIISSFSWSPDSRWIVYSPRNWQVMSKIYIHDTQSGENHQVTESWYSANSPHFSHDGKYLIFASSRTFNPIYNNIEWNVAYQDMKKIYIVPLLKSTPSPFLPENDMVNTSEDKKEEKTNKKSKKKKKEENSKPKITVKIDFDNIQNRVIELPVEASNYGNIYYINGKIYYNYYKSATRKRGIKMFDLKTKEEKGLAENMSFIVSRDRKKFLVWGKNKYAVIDVPSGKILPKKYLDLSDVKAKVNLQEEWKQIYYEAWRQMRDFFYVENMHGVDWEAMKDKYAALLPHVQHKTDLNYIIGELIGELNVGHAYIGGGDRPHPERIKLGLLGAKLSKDASGFYKIDKILANTSWNKTRRNPLKAIGININEGDFILAINGNSTKNMNDIYEGLVGMAGKKVELTVNSTPTMNGSKKYIVEPIADESELYYYEWITNNMKKVNEATNGEVGYIHIRDMGPQGLHDFMSNFYSQLSKKALIIDDRGNGGGNVSPMLIERLRRHVTRANMSRNMTTPSHVPRQMILGPKVLLMNQYSASDGDLFPYSFKKHKLGKTIGVRTWGGVVGISGSLPFIDGTDLRKPEHASYSSEKSEWIIEGHGVEPDIVVENDPAQEYMGVDAQLEKAIEVIKEELKNYQPLPDIPEGPDKTK